MVDDDDNPEWTDENTKPLDHAAKLKVTRARLSLSQPDLAALLNIPVATIRNWEQRRTAPDGPAQRLIELLYDDPRGMRARLDRAAA